MKPASPESPKPASRLRVLVVEDHDTTRHWMAETLAAAGYRVDEAIDGLDALRKASADHHHAIVLDLMMPHVDGWQFRETALRHPELASIPTVIATVRPLREAERYALKTPFVLHKPVEASALVAMVEAACAMGAPRPDVDGHRPAFEKPLFWSKRGEVACAQHAPEAESERWRAERWAAIPEGAGSGRITYQCQHCVPQRPIYRSRT